MPRSICDCIRDHKIIPCKMISNTVDRHIQWSILEPGWFKLNYDGAFVEIGEKGGILRSDSGNFVFDFTVNLGPCSVMEAELWAILNGLKLAKDKGFDKIQLETNSLAAMRIIQMDCSPLHPSFILIEEIKSLDGAA